ncbi:MAG: hypothetical protein AB7P21_20545 [Lautropia sp.]
MRILLGFAGAPAGYFMRIVFRGDGPTGSATYRPASGGWVSVGVARYVAIALLGAVGIHAFDDLPVTRFALNEKAKSMLTPAYSFALASNFRPMRDYEANLRAVRLRCTIVAGAADEAFVADAFEPTIRGAGVDWPVRLLPGIGHIALTLEPSAIDAAVDAVDAMRGRARGAGRAVVPGRGSAPRDAATGDGAGTAGGD